VESEFDRLVFVLITDGTWGVTTGWSIERPIRGIEMSDTQELVQAMQSRERRATKRTLPLSRWRFKIQFVVKLEGNWNSDAHVGTRVEWAKVNRFQARTMPK